MCRPSTRTAFPCELALMVAGLTGIVCLWLIALASASIAAGLRRHGYRRLVQAAAWLWVGGSMLAALLLVLGRPALAAVVASGSGICLVAVVTAVDALASRPADSPD